MWSYLNAGKCGELVCSDKQVVGLHINHGQQQVAPTSAPQNTDDALIPRTARQPCCKQQALEHIVQGTLPCHIQYFQYINRMSALPDTFLLPDL